MIGQSLPEYYFIRACIAALRLVAPLSIAYILACLATGSILVSPVLGIVAASEAAVFVVYLIRRKGFNEARPQVPPRLTRAQRRELFEKCASHISSDYPSGWFLPQNSEFKRENVNDWLLWALFDSAPEHASEEWTEEITQYISVVEECLGRKLEPGRAPGVKSLRLSFDPVKMLHRPLIWYLIVALVDTCTSLFLLSLGFKHYAPRRTCFSAFPPRLLLTLFSKPVTTPHFPYWYRAPRGGQGKSPILFLHGIGIGLHPYIPLFREILRADPTQSLLLVEFLPVSMRMTDPMPSRRKTIAAINAILEDLSIDRVVLAAHSYGTFIAAHIVIQQAPDSASSPSDSDPDLDTDTDTDLDPLHALNRRVAALILIDPVPILLHLPAVAYNFLYRTPGARRANEWQLWYFASRDADIARVLSRGFFWEESCLWRADLARFSADGQGRKVAVVLAGEDQIVPSAEVRKYLTSGEAGDSARGVGGVERWMSHSGLLQVFWFPTLDHAMVFETRERRKVLVRTLAWAVEPPHTSYGAVGVI